MMKMRSAVIRVCCVSAILAFAGCWTVREAKIPRAEVVAMPEGKATKVQIAGFDATVTTYATAYAYTTVSGYGGPYCDSRGPYYCGMGTTTYSTTQYIPQTVTTPVYRDRAASALERAGCVLQAADPQYKVEVRFDGPHADGKDSWRTALWMICTLFTSDFGAQSWTASLTIHDLASGQLVHEKSLSVRDAALVWGPIPIFSPACSSRTSGGVMQKNCLTALTDLAVADAVAFLAGR